MRHLRVVLAFLVAPLMTPVVFMAFDLFEGRLVLLNQVPFYFMTYGVFAYLATAVFGTGAFFLFRLFKWNNVILFVAGGAMIGLVVSLFIMEGGSMSSFARRIEERLVCALAGGLSALVFRMVLSKLDLGTAQPSS